MNPPVPGAAGSTSNRSPLIPRDQDEKASLGLRVAKSWGTNPQLTLIWKTQAEFATEAQAFADALSAKNAEAAKRPQVGVSLDSVDEKIKAGLSFVKNYLAEKFGKKAAPAYYPEFGITFYDDSHQLPRRQTERAEALKVLVKSLGAYGLGARDYGTAYWEPLRDQYAAATTAGRDSASSVSSQVGAKNAALDSVDKVLSALPALIEANYPDDGERRAKLREMGYLKEYN